jgi:hypothetical protein
MSATAVDVMCIAPALAPVLVCVVKNALPQRFNNDSRRWTAQCAKASKSK